MTHIVKYLAGRFALATLGGCGIAPELRERLEPDAAAPRSAR